MSFVPYMQSVWRFLWQSRDWISRMFRPVQAIWKWVFPRQTELANSVTSRIPLSYNAIGMDYRPPVIAVIHHSRYAVVAKLEAGVVLKYSRYAWWDYPDAMHNSAVQEARHSFFVEEEILKVLGDHPRITKFLGPCSPQGLKFAEADQGNLEQYIKSHFSTLTVHVQAGWALQAAEAIAYIHSKGVVHSDLRPENYLVYSRADGGLDLRLCDFGGSKYGDLYGGNLPDAGFFNPRNGAAPTEGTDVFSLGSVFFTVCLGHWPHWGGQEEDYRAYQERVDDLFSRGEFPPVKHACGSVIEGCWAGRYATAGLLVGDCRKLYAGLSGMSDHQM